MTPLQRQQEERKMTLFHWAELIFLAALWGASFLFMRVAAPEFGPIALIELRVLIAAIFLVPILISRGGLKPLRNQMRHLSILGIINSAIPFCLFAFATLSVTAGFASVLNSTAPFFTALIGWFWLKERMTFTRVMGLVIGFTGVLMLLWGKASFKSGGGGLAIAAGLTATFLYGISANYTKKNMAGVPPLVLATGSQISASLFLLPFALLAMPASMPSLKAWIMVLCSGVLATAIPYMLFFRLLTQLGATRAIAVTFLIPVFGLFWGAWILGEGITLNMYLGTIVILTGTILTTGFKISLRPISKPSVKVA